MNAKRRYRRIRRRRGKRWEVHTKTQTHPGSFLCHHYKWESGKLTYHHCYSYFGNVTC